MSQQGTSNRQLKVAEAIKVALIEVLQKGKAPDPRLFDAKITITYVTVTPDLKLATCYVLPLLSSSTARSMDKAELMDALEKSKYQLRALVTAKINLKYSPELKFSYDHGAENAGTVESILQNIR